MHRIILILMASCFLFVTTSVSDLYVNQPVDKTNQNLVIYLDGEKLEQKSTGMAIGEIGLPVKELGKKLGFSITEDTPKKVVVDTGTIITFDFEKKKVFIDGKEHPMNTPAVQIEKETYVTAHELAKMFGVEYQIDKKEIKIKRKPLN